jgi:hypothetical protein
MYIIKTGNQVQSFSIQNIGVQTGVRTCLMRITM